ncbi:hypothetical protein CEXT_682421 [Caerostris extrusa]|uniref:Uncharacterized protein n=1 Tax=Caerostris extrusa TaxID=172846 RepID=A0AAV4XWP8_CAEEX|nr:hypothetical protein CEXT_682421 [Caerostris extrusa]
MRLPFPLQEAALHSEAPNYASSPISVIFQQIVRVGQQRKITRSMRNEKGRTMKGGGKEVWLLVILALEERSAGGVGPQRSGGVYGKLGPRDHVTEAAEVSRSC